MGHEVNATGVNFGDFDASQLKEVSLKDNDEFGLKSKTTEEIKKIFEEVKGNFVKRVEKITFWRTFYISGGDSETIAEKKAIQIADRVLPYNTRYAEALFKELASRG